MADPPPSPDRDATCDRGLAAGTPRWVKVSGIIALAVLLWLLVLLLAGGNHGPGRHRSSPALVGPPPAVGTAAHDRRSAMVLPPRLRKLALTAHVATSVGWLGAVIAFLALSVTSQDPQTVRGAYLVMELTGWVVPLSLASLLTGLICALGSI